MADHQWQWRFACQLCKPQVASVEKMAAQQQVLWRIAGERQLRGEQQVGTARCGILCRSKDAGAVAGEVADGGVDLGEADAHVRQCSEPEPRRTPITTHHPAGRRRRCAHRRATRWTRSLPTMKP